MIASAIIGGVSAATGLGLGIAGSVKANKKAKEAKAAYESAKAEENMWFNKEYYQDWTDRTEVQQALRLAAEEQKEQQKRAAAQAEITGATDEAKLAAQDKVNKNYSDTIAQIATNLSTLKNSTLNNYRNRMNVLNQQGIEMLTNESNQNANLAANGYKTFGSGIGTMTGALVGLYGGNTNTNTNT